MKNLAQLLQKLMGIHFEDEPLEPSIVYSPNDCQCPVEKCDGRGKYTACYLQTLFPKCTSYIVNRNGETK